MDTRRNVALGAIDQLEYHITHAQLAPGDTLFLFTDGVTEAHGPDGMFGQERLISAVLDGVRGADLLDRLLSDVMSFTNTPGNKDDITLLSLDLAGPAGS